jgi:hypothetical protein
VRKPSEDNSDRSSDVADRIKGLIVADDLKNVGCLCCPEPAAGIDCNPEIAPVLHAEDRGAVNQIGASVCEEPRRFCGDNPPVANRDNFGVIPGIRQSQVAQHCSHVVAAAGVFHVEENHPTRSVCLCGLALASGKGDGLRFRRSTFCYRARKSATAPSRLVEAA